MLTLSSPITQRPQLPHAPRPILLIGAGGIVRDAHLPAYRQAGFPVVGVYDLSQDKATALAHDFGIAQVYPSLAAALAAAPAGVVFDVAVPASATLDILQRLPPRSVILSQ